MAQTAPTEPTPGQSELEQVLVGDTSGTAILDEHPEVVAAIAERNDIAESETRSLLSDERAWVHKTGDIFFAEPTPERDPAAGPEVSVPEPGPFPYNQTFTLHSRPGSSRTIYLDFNGHTISGTVWAADDGGSYTAVPFDSDGSLATFGDTELDAIQFIWQRVAEDFAPFDVDVTTQEPDPAAIDRSSLADSVYGTRTVITDSAASDVTSVSTTGVAQLNAFDKTGNPSHAMLQPAWAFSQGLFDNSRYIAEIVSHEVGHNVGLSHDGQSPSETYYRGHGVWAPIMGAGFDRPVVQWSKGEYTNANQTQDDIAVMASHGAVARADDHTNNTGTATTVTTGAAGIITPGAQIDADLFTWVAPSTQTVTFAAVPAPNGPNLDIVLRLYSSALVELASSNPAAAFVSPAQASGLNASISHAVTLGQTYYLQVAPTGHLTAADGYTTYGSLGQYTLSVGGLPACTDDAFEPNDSIAATNPAASGQAIAGQICTGNDDWFAIEGVAGQQVAAAAGFTHANGDLDLELFDPAGARVAMSDGTTNLESANVTATMTGRYAVRIYGYGGAQNAYSLTLTSPTCPPDDSFEPNDTFGTAGALPPGGAFRAIACPSNDDYYAVQLATGNTFQADVLFAHRFGDVDVRLLDSAGAVVASSLGTTDNEHIQFVVTSAGVHRLHVFGYGGALNTYSATVNTGDPATTVPGAPTGVTATAGNASASVTWTAPISNGGSAVTGYTVTASPGGATAAVSGATTTAVVTGLTNATSYTFTVVATNSVGNSASSAPSNQVTPTAPPALRQPSDFDGNGTTDKAIYRPSTGQWFVRGGSPEVTQYGVSDDIPVPGDFDGNGTTDKAIYRPSTGQWFVRGGSPEVTQYGVSADIPVPGDFDGNGTTDKAVYRPSTGQWFVLGGSPETTQYGVGGDVPAIGDYDGGAGATTDKAVYRPSTGQWFVRGGSPEVTQYGVGGDISLTLPHAVRRVFFP